MQYRMNELCISRFRLLPEFFISCDVIQSQVLFMMPFYQSPPMSLSLDLSCFGWYKYKSHQDYSHTKNVSIPGIYLIAEASSSPSNELCFFDILWSSPMLLLTHWFVIGLLNCLFRWMFYRAVPTVCCFVVLIFPELMLCSTSTMRPRCHGDHSSSCMPLVVKAPL